MSSLWFVDVVSVVVVVCGGGGCGGGGGGGVFIDFVNITCFRYLTISLAHHWMASRCS